MSLQDVQDVITGSTGCHSRMSLRSMSLQYFIRGCQYRMYRGSLQDVQDVITGCIGYRMSFQNAQDVITG